MSIETKTSEKTSVSFSELEPPVALEATWRSVPTWGKETGDPDCGTLRVVVAGAPGVDEFKNQAYGAVLSRAGGRKMATLDTTQLDPDYRGRGIGSRMYRAFTRLAMEHGADQLGSVSPTADAMRVRLRLFGPERLKFYDRGDEDVEEVVTTEVEISAEEVQARIDANETFRSYTEQLREKYGDKIGERISDAEKAQSKLYAAASKAFSVVVDLRGLDTSTWESEVLASTI